MPERKTVEVVVWAIIDAARQPIGFATRAGEEEKDELDALAKTYSKEPFYADRLPLRTVRLVGTVEVDDA